MYQKLSKNALKCLYISTAVATIIFLAIILALQYFIFIPNEYEIPILICWIAIVLLILDLFISPRFRFNRYHYKIDDEAIDITEGYLFQERHIVPIERLHKLEINRGPIDRICKVAKVTVTTAGGDVTIRFVDEERAEQIVDGLKHRINQIALEEKQEERESDEGK